MRFFLSMSKKSEAPQTISITNITIIQDNTNKFIANWNGIRVSLTKAPNTHVLNTLSRNSHQNIAQLFGVLHHNANTFYVTEYSIKGTLFDVLQDVKCELSWNRRLPIILDITKGLHFLHQHSLIHGDLRSENIILDESWTAKITNIGNPNRSSWSSPELILRKERPSTRSDIFSYGMTLWEISSRKIPFADYMQEEDVLQLIASGKTEEISSDFPSDVADIIYQCWNMKSEDRPKISQILDRLTLFQRNFIRHVTLPHVIKEEESMFPISGKAIYEAGKKFWEMGRNGEAIPYFQEAAEFGHPCAFLRLDHKTQKMSRRAFYRKKIEENIEWFKAQASTGEPHALYNLALCYEMGYGPLHDPNKAIELYLQSASSGYPRGICAAGKVYSDLREYDKAMECYKKGIDHGILLPFTSIGYCYEMGLGVNVDLAQSVKYYTIAAEKGEFTAQYNLAICYQYGQGVPRDLEKAIYWHTKAASVNTPEACYQLALIYRNSSTSGDKEKGYKYLKKAAQRGNKSAENLLRKYNK